MWHGVFLLRNQELARLGCCGTRLLASTQTSKQQAGLAREGDKRKLSNAYARRDTGFETQKASHSFGTNLRRASYTVVAHTKSIQTHASWSQHSSAPVFRCGCHAHPSYSMHARTAMIHGEGRKKDTTHVLMEKEPKPANEPTNERTNQPMTHQRTNAPTKRTNERTNQQRTYENNQPTDRPTNQPTFPLSAKQARHLPFLPSPPP